MALDLETMLAPISEADPVGPNLEYDSERQQLEQAFEQLKEAAGTEGGGSADWRTILKLIESQFSKTKDVSLAVYACRAGAMSGSLQTVELGAQALAGLFERYWDTVHPQLEELGFIGRKSPCDSLSGRGDFLIPLQKVVLVEHRVGSFTGLDLEQLASKMEAADRYGLFRAALEDLGEAALQEPFDRLSNIETALRTADRIFMDAALPAGEPCPNFGPAYEMLAGMKRSLKAFMAGAPGETSDDAEGADAAPAGGGGGAPAAKRISGQVESREDVLRVLDSIADYYRRSEPSHPVQQLLQRAKHWVTMDFMELIADIAPDSFHQANAVLNKRDN